MNLTKTCPDIPDEWKGGITDVAKTLGLSQATIRKYALIGKRHGGLDYTLANNGRMRFAGKEIKRFWKSF